MKSNIISKELQKEFKRIGNQEREIDPFLVCKIYHPLTSEVYYMISYSSRSNTGVAYKVDIASEGFVFVDLKELEYLNYDSLSFEVDLSFEPQRLTKKFPYLRQNLLDRFRQEKGKGTFRASNQSFEIRRLETKGSGLEKIEKVKREEEKKQSFEDRLRVARESRSKGRDIRFENEW